MATGELRDRVRSKLVVDRYRTCAGQGGPRTDGRSRPASRRRHRDEVALRHSRLTTAIADFDAATIDTTHGFCLHVLMGLGVAGDVERDAKLVEDVTDLLEEVVDDLYVRRFWQAKGAPKFERGRDGSRPRSRGQVCGTS